MATLLNFEVDLPVKQKSALSSVMRIFKKALSRRVSRLFEGRWKKDYYYLLPKLEKEVYFYNFTLMKIGKIMDETIIGIQK